MSFWTDKKVLLTGATGFLGGWLTRRLLTDGADIVAIVRQSRPLSQFALEGFDRRVRVRPGAAEDPATIAAAFAADAFDGVFHLAAMADVNAALRDPPAAMRASIDSTLLILEQLRHTRPDAVAVIASSDKAYGAQPLPFREDLPLHPRHPYEIAKATQDLLAQSYGRLFGLKVAVTRCGNFFGGYDFAFERIVPHTIRQILRGEAPVLRSDGRFTRDFLHVEAAAEATLLLAERLAADASVRGQAFNFSHEVEIPVIDLVCRIADIMGSALRPRIAATATAEIRRMRLDTAKARTMLGWQPTVDFAEGLRRTVAWYAEHLGAFERRGLLGR